VWSLSDVFWCMIGPACSVKLLRIVRATRPRGFNAQIAGKVVVLKTCSFWGTNREALHRSVGQARTEMLQRQHVVPDRNP
jgi:hypothetical protein